MYEVRVYVFTNNKSIQYVFSQKELNLRQRRGSDLLKYYYMGVLYLCGKANVVADSLSRMTMVSVSHIDEAKNDLVKEVHMLDRLELRLEGSPNRGSIVHHNSNSSLVVEVKSKQHLDQPLMELKELVPRQVR